jgi:hypothetical protein
MKRFTDALYFKWEQQKKEEKKKKKTKKKKTKKRKKKKKKKKAEEEEEEEGTGSIQNFMCFGHGNETLYSINDMEFFDLLIDLLLLKKNSA